LIAFALGRMGSTLKGGEPDASHDCAAGASEVAAPRGSFYVMAAGKAIARRGGLSPSLSRFEFRCRTIGAAPIDHQRLGKLERRAQR